MFSWKSFETLGKPTTPFAWNCCSWNSVWFSPFLCHSCLLWGHREHWEARAAVWSKQREGWNSARPLLPKGNMHWKSRELEGETEETTYFSLSEPLLWCCRLRLLLFLGKGQKRLFICLQWFVGAVLSPACRVICKQAAPLGSTNVFFLKP